jgi:hypothetical protein
VGTGNSSSSSNSNNNNSNNTHRIAVKGVTAAAAAAAAASGLVLARAYNAALDALTTFRVAHLKLAHDFISKPARGIDIARGEDGSGNRMRGGGGNAAVEQRACPFSDARSSPAASAGAGSSSLCPFMQTRTAAAESPLRGRGRAEEGEGGEGNKGGDGKGEREEKVTEASQRGATGTGGSPFEAYLSKHIKATRRSKVCCSRVY